MTEWTDMELVRQFARTQSEAAFAELVRRHLNLVYSAAFRYARQDQDAQDIAQAVFLVLARKAGSLRDQTVLAGWLYETTRFAAARWQRSQMRRQSREQEVAMQAQENEADGEAWHQIAPLLDDVMGKLGETDRTVLVLRFFEHQTNAEVAAALGLSEAAVQKRGLRALEKLRGHLARQGVTHSAAAIAGTLTENAMMLAPAALVIKVTTIAVPGTLAAVSLNALANETIKHLAMTTLQKTLITATLIVTAGAGLYEAHETAQARAELLALRQQQAPLAELNRQLQAERDQATNRLAALDQELADNQKRNLETLKLRGEVGLLRNQVNQLADGAGKNAAASGQELAEKLASQADFIRDDEKRKSQASLISTGIGAYVFGKGGNLPADFNQVTNVVTENFPKGVVRTEDLAAYEFLNLGAKVLIQNGHGTIVNPDLADKLMIFREKTPRLAPDGIWYRIYGRFGFNKSVVTATSADGNFDDWEKANTYQPATNP